MAVKLIFLDIPDSLLIRLVIIIKKGLKKNK